jgi:hypothetical protein
VNLNIAVVGAAKGGKTLFCINFAEYLGARALCYTENSPFGAGRGVTTPETARALMVDPGPRCNGVVRSFAVNRPHRQPRRIALIDTASLKEKSPLPRAERKKLILTLQALQEADAVLYLADLACYDPVGIDFALASDRGLSRYCFKKGKPYLVVATKCDLPHARKNPYIEQFFCRNGRIPFISSLTREGFAQLRRQLFEQPALFMGARL